MIDQARRRTSICLYYGCHLFLLLATRAAPKDHPWRTFVTEAHKQAHPVALRALKTPTPGRREFKVRAKMTRELWASTVGTGALAGPTVAGVLSYLASINQLPVSF